MESNKKKYLLIIEYYGKYYLASDKNENTIVFNSRKDAKKYAEEHLTLEHDYLIVELY